jgi:tetratricopeptide (TPR) repeat protein
MMPAIEILEEIEDALPVAEPVLSQYEVAAQVLERAVQSGCQDANVLYMLALAHKRQGKTNEARAALRKIARPDANVILQMGLLSLDEGNLPQAEAEFVRAWGMDTNSYETCYNLLLTQLTLGKIDECTALLPAALELLDRNPVLPPGAYAPDERRYLQLLHALLRMCDERSLRDPRFDPVLSEMTANDEQRLLKVIRSLGQLDVVHTLLKALTAARPRSGAVREAYIEAVLVKAKESMDRCNWTEAELILRPLANDRGASRANQVALLNLLGCCACLTQDFGGAVRYFQAGLKLSDRDARLHQNLALTHELLGDLASADPHWNRYFDLLDQRVPAPPDVPRYQNALAYESLNRLASRYSEKEKWASALGYVQRAARLRPDDPDTLERLFHLYNHAERPQDARQALNDLRRLRPTDPQLELYELDLVKVKGLADIEKLLMEIDRILKRYPGDARVEERAVSMVGNVIPLMGNLCDQLTEQMGKVIDQVRHLPNYQINWTAVRDVMRDLLREFQKLRRIVGKCMPLVTSDEHKRIVRDLADHIDKKMEACRSMGA